MNFFGRKGGNISSWKGEKSLLYPLVLNQRDVIQLRIRFHNTSKMYIFESEELL